MSRRCKTLRINTNFFPSIFGRDVRQIYEVSANGLPPDANVVNVRMSPDFQHLIFLIESREFDEVPDSNHYPEIEPKLRQFGLRDLNPTEPNKQLLRQAEKRFAQEQAKARPDVANDAWQDGGIW